jgi:uncharacterized membrane protein YidH (DUF202 family)
LTGVGRASESQPERTALAWTRTSLAVLGNGALLMVKNLGGHIGPLRLSAAGLAVAIALLAYALGIRRQRTLCRRPLPKRITPRREVAVLGTALLLLILISALALIE